jgi:hypothetical protein
VTRGQRAALFWLFLALFTAIGAVSILVAVGLFPNADPAFRKVAIGTFIAGVIGDMLALFRVAFAPQSELRVTLDFTDESGQEVQVNLEDTATFQIWDREKRQAGKPQSIIVERNRESARWYVRLPSNIVVGESVRIQLKERSGHEWQVPFSPPSISLEATRR